MVTKRFFAVIEIALLTEVKINNLKEQNNSLTTQISNLAREITELTNKSVRQQGKRHF